LATFIRTVIIVGISAAVVTWRSEWMNFKEISGKTYLFLALSAVATGLSWLCYYRAIQLGPVSKVAILDKLSVVLVVIFSVLFLKETLTLKLALGTLMIAFGILLCFSP
jgi:transporter family protein